MASVAVIGAGSSGLITAKTLLDDGFAVTIFTRDMHVGGAYAQERLYPGLQMNNVHGEFHFSSLPMPQPKNSSKTGGRLSGKDMQTYMEGFANQKLEGTISFGKEVLGVRRGTGNRGWIMNVKDLASDVTQEMSFDKVVLCTGGNSNPSIPAAISPDAARNVGFNGPIIHSSEFAREHDSIVSHAKKNSTGSERGKVVVVGGGKSAQDISTQLSKQDLDVTMVFETTDAHVAAPIPLPGFVRKSRYLAVFSPHADLETRLERFLHTTTVGSFITRGFWSFLHKSSLQLLGVSSSDPLAPSFHTFWTLRIDDLGKPSADGFHAQYKQGNIALAAPARVVGYARDEEKQYVVLSDGRKLEADAVVLATGFKSSWGPILNAETRRELELEPYDLGETLEQVLAEPYASLRNPPVKPNPQPGILIYRGIAPIGNLDKRDFAINGANFCSANGMVHEVSAHWISSYFLRDPFMRIPEHDQALFEARRAASFVRRRYPETWTWVNESFGAGIFFWNWPQLMDSLLSDMGLKTMRSGGTWLNWIFKVMDVKEIANLGGERRQLRRASSA